MGFPRKSERLKMFLPGGKNLHSSILNWPSNFYICQSTLLWTSHEHAHRYRALQTRFYIKVTTVLHKTNKSNLFWKRSCIPTSFFQCFVIPDRFLTSEPSVEEEGCLPCQIDPTSSTNLIAGNGWAGKFLLQSYFGNQAANSCSIIVF